MGNMAYGHPQVGLHLTSGGLAGFLHPFLGLDHLLAMLTIGLLAAQRGGRMLWVLPATFVGAMSVGGVFGMLSTHLDNRELGIALSVAFLGAAVMLGGRLPASITISMAVLFGFFHGHAHGSELPQMASALSYTVGFIVATALLHLVGVITGVLAINRAQGARRLRLSGGAVLLTGMVMVCALLS